MEKNSLLEFFGVLISKTRGHLTPKNKLLGLDFLNFVSNYLNRSHTELSKKEHKNLGLVEISTFSNKISSRFFSSFMMIFLLFVIAPFSLLGQQLDLRDNPAYVLGNCPANDIQILGANLVTGSQCNTCSPGDLLTAQIKVTIHHNTNSDNRYLAIMADLTETLPDGTTTVVDFLRCSGPVVKSSDEVDGKQVLDYGTITFTCGSSLNLSNILLVWTAANGNCPLTTANNPNGKYCYSNPTILIIPPFNAVLKPTCGLGNTENIDLVVSGGSGNFSYSWDTGAITQDLTNVAIGTHTVTVTDNIIKDANGISCKITGSVTFDGPCCVAPEITLQPSNQIKCVGENASFSVSYSGGNPAPTLQWQLSTNGGTNWGDIATETNATLTLNGVTAAMNGNLYRVVLTSGSCTPVNSDSASLTVGTYPTALLLTGHDFCASSPNTGSITSSTSANGVSYQLYDSSDAVVQSAKNGTGSGLTWSNLSAGTGYYVIATGAAPTSCTSTSAPANVVQVANPTALLLTGHDFCASSPNTGSITSSTSANGVSYQLYDSSDAVVQSAKNGTGSGLTWSNLSAGTGYYVIATGATPTNCTSTSAPANVVQVANPTALLLTGHDFCASSPNTGSITSSTSANGVSYQLYDSSNAVVQSAKNGTGSGLTWSNLSAGTGYYVIATGAAPTNCTSTSAPANVVQNQTPVLVITTPPTPCTPGTTDLTAAAVTSNSSLPSGTTLSYYKDNGGAIGVQITSSAAAAVSAGTYWIKATSLANCTDAKPVTIPVNNCNGNIYATATTCSTFLAGENTLDKICYTVATTTKGRKTVNTISNATPGVFFYYAKIVAPSTLPAAGTSLNVNVIQYNTSKTVLNNPADLPNFLIQQGQVFVFDSNCNKIATGTIDKTNPGNAIINLSNVKPGQILVISVKYDVKTIVGKTLNDIVGPDYQAYFISKVVYGGVIPIEYSNPGNIRVYNCSPSTALATVAKTADTSAVEDIVSTDETTTSKTKTAVFTVYPVPFKDQLTIRYNFNYVSDVKIEVFNAKGNLVIIKNDANGYLNKEISLNLTETGQSEIYIVKLTTSRGSSIQKIISSR